MTNWARYQTGGPLILTGYLLYIYLKKIFTWKFTPYVPLSKVANIGLDVAQLMSFGAYKDPDKWLWALAWFKKSTKVSIRKYW